MQLDEAIAHSEVTHGKYRLSIGTSLALETLFGINDNIAPTNPLPYTKYSFVIINVRTLIRNVYGAVQKELKQEWPADRYLEKVREELDEIPIILENQSHGKLHAIYYISSYKSLARKFPKAHLKSVGSKAYGRQHYEAIEQYCISRLTAATIRGDYTIALTDIDLPPAEQPSAIITHMPVDLLSYTKSKFVDLIETHTGVIKPKSQWYTKLNGKGVERIPFDAWSIQWFGDGKQFTGVPPKYRAAVIDFSIRNKWNQTTTPAIIKAQLGRFPDKEISAELKRYL